MNIKKYAGITFLVGAVLVAVFMVFNSQNSTTETSKPSTFNVDSEHLKTAMFANGCFWCVESDLQKVMGVLAVVSGYAGGSNENPTYKNYADFGHREVVLVTYDSSKVSYSNLVEHILKHGDPTDNTGSFYDRGVEYAPAIYFATDEERNNAELVIARVDESKVFESPLPIVVVEREKFWPAEEYHQDYAEKNPLRYSYYRKSSGRDDFINEHWGEELKEFTFSRDIEDLSKSKEESVSYSENSWQNFQKPTDEELRELLTPLQYKVTQKDGTEKPFDNPLDKNYEAGIYVDIVSGEPLYLSIDKYDSGTGWPSFVKPISEEVVVLKEDNTLFTKRTEVRSRYADSHLGHVFDDGPKDRGGKRYCMNSAAMKFVAYEDMEREGYGYLLEKFD